MRKLILAVAAFSGVVLGIIMLAVLIWPKHGLRRTSFAEHRVLINREAGLQMEIPTETPFVSGSAAGVLVMVHQIGRGFHAEAGYLVKVHVQRKSKEDMDDSAHFASQSSGDEIQQWRCRIHSRLDVKQTADLWYVRKDIETPEGECLSVDVELTVTEFAEADLAETRRMVESIALIPLGQ
jgi:hypothetical protein